MIKQLRALAALSEKQDTIPKPCGSLQPSVTPFPGDHMPTTTPVGSALKCCTDIVGDERQKNHPHKIQISKSFSLKIKQINTVLINGLISTLHQQISPSEKPIMINNSAYDISIDQSKIQI